MEVPSRKMALIASKGTLDMAYPPLILASTARTRLTARVDAEIR
jgi:peroxiredoxin family protein